MITFEVRRRLFWGLVWSFLLFGVVGCQTTPPRTHSSGSSLTPASVRKSVPIIPAPRDSKPTRKPARAHDDRVVDHDAATEVDQPAHIPAGVPVEQGAGSKADRARKPIRSPEAGNPNQPRPDRKRTKPKESEYERHPSKWREKLKAKYA
ncbi:MAG: hypothetical protein KF841_09505 [Phycisphaerae bacterium]|nr:hypothetical protein [Phycisphaerae bacterium]